MTALARLFAALALVALVASPGCGTEGEPDTTPDAGAPAADAGAPGVVPLFMEPCELGGDGCAEGLVCFEFTTRGPHCTHACTMDSDCEAPSRGCNNKGVCKAP